VYNNNIFISCVGRHQRLYLLPGMPSSSSLFFVLFDTEVQLPSKLLSSFKAVPLSHDKADYHKFQVPYPSEDTILLAQYYG